MYILRQPEQFRDTLKLVDKDGREQMVEISLKITPDMIKSYRQLQVKLHDLQNDSRAAEDKAEDMGRAVYALLSLLFGEENTDDHPPVLRRGLYQPGAGHLPLYLRHHRPRLTGRCEAAESAV